MKISGGLVGGGGTIKQTIQILFFFVILLIEIYKLQAQPQIKHSNN